MRVKFLIVSGILTATPLLNCSEADAPSQDITPPTPEIKTAPEPTTVPDSAAQQITPTGHQPAPPAHAGDPEDLVGTTWVAGSHTFSFQAGGNFVVSGGNFDAFAPGGVPGILKNRKGLIELKVMGRMNWGIWDGETLTINGIPAIRQDAPKPEADTDPE